MRLNDALITSFFYENKEFEVDLSFDNVLDVFDVLQDKTLREYEMAEICLALLIDDQEYESPTELWNYIYESFIKFENKEPIRYDLKGNPMPVREDDEEDEQYMDLEQDAEYIYSSFRQAYQIDLFKEQGNLHWHQFKSLLSGLPSDTIMQRIIQIRAYKPSKGESAEYKESMKKLQQIYALREVD